MTLKKMLVSLVALAVSSVAFAFPAPPDDTDPINPILSQYTSQIEEMNRTFDEKVLPPLKGLLQIAKAFGESTQTELTPEQEQAWNQHQTALSKALTDMVTPIVEQADMRQVNEMFKQIFQATGQPVREITKQEFSDMLAGMMAISALGHFQETHKLTEEEMELAMLLFFPGEEEEE